MMPSLPASTRRLSEPWGWTLLAGAVAALVAFNFWTVVFAPSLGGLTHGFPLYYTSARLAAEGRWDHRVYEDAWFGDEVVKDTGGRVREIFWPNPPAAALMLMPATGFALADARRVWQAISLVALVASVWLLAASFRAPPAFGLVLLAGALVFGPVRQNFRIAQAYTLLLLLFVAAWRQSERGRASSGVLLGLATAFKWQGLPVWAILAASRKWRAVAAGAATVLAVVGVSSLATGWTSWPTYFNHMMTAPPRNWMLSIEFQGTHNLITHLLVADPAFNPRPQTHNPRAAIVISSALSVAAVAFTMWRARRMPVPHAFAAAVALSVVLSPFALDYHYTLLFLPLAVMSNAVRHSRTIPDTLWLSIVVAMTAVPWRRYLPQLDEMAFGLYAFVRLYGGWLLWLWLIRRKDDVRSPAPGGS